LLTSHDSRLNLSKQADRNRLAKQAYGQWKDWPVQCPLEWLQHQVLLFCDGLWNYHVLTSPVDWVYPAETDELAPFLLKPFILSEAGTIVVAAPGSGKSYTALLMALSIQFGQGYLWEEVRPGPVIYVNLERGERSMQRRLRRVAMALQLDPDAAPLLMINARGRSLSDVIDHVRLAVREHEASVVFLDSLSRAGVGDLTSNEAANRAMDFLNGLGCAWVALAHPPRQGKNVYGSQMFDAAADLVVSLTPENTVNRMGVGLEITKANDTPMFKPHVLVYEFDPEYGLVLARKARLDEYDNLKERAMERQHHEQSSVRRIPPPPGREM